MYRSISDSVGKALLERNDESMAKVIVGLERFHAAATNSHLHKNLVSLLIE
jgi:hypothetical protein